MQREENECTEKLSAFIDKIKKDKKILMIIGFALTGMLLILFSGGESSAEKLIEKENISTVADEYESKLQGLISKIEGVGKVNVMITFESGEENVFASDKEESFRNDEQKIKNDYIIVDSDNGETGLKIKSIYPKIKGVAVVCGGASDPVIKEQIVSVVSALFDISIKNISIVLAEK